MLLQKNPPLWVNDSAAAYALMSEVEAGRLVYLAWAINAMQATRSWCNLRRVELTELGHEQFAFHFGLHVNQSLIERFNKAILQHLQPLNLIRYRYETHLTQKLASCKMKQRGGTVSLGFLQLSGIFLVHLGASLLACAVLALERHLKKRLQHTTHLPKQEHSASDLAVQVVHADQSPNLWY